MATPIPASGVTTTYTSPEYYTQTGQQLAGGVQGMLGDTGYINQTMGNWYDQAPNQGALGQYSQFNNANQQQFMNPYVNNVVNEQARLSNENLFNKIIPEINSTFTGAGQFGSTRNADFMNRAIQDQQTQLTGQQGQTLFGAQQAAGQQYRDWTKMGLDAGQQDFSNWMEQAKFPLGALAQMGQTYGTMRPNDPQSVSSQSGTTDNLQKLSGVLGVLNSGLTDGTINNLLQWAGLNFNQ